MNKTSLNIPLYASFRRGIRAHVGAEGAFDLWLLQRGFSTIIIRTLVRWQAVSSVVFLTGGLCLWPMTPWFFWFGLGASLSAWNFYELANFIQRYISNTWSTKLLIQLLLRSNGRLLFTGIFLYATLVWCGASVVALLAGLSMVLVYALIALVMLRM